MNLCQKKLFFYFSFDLLYRLLYTYLEFDLYPGGKGVK